MSILLISIETILIVRDIGACRDVFQQMSETAVQARFTKQGVVAVMNSGQGDGRSTEFTPCSIRLTYVCNCFTDELELLA
jgi:hypothetical protein